MSPIKLFLFVMMAMVCAPGLAQMQWIWAQSHPQSDIESLVSSESDSDGNIYTTISRLSGYGKIYKHNRYGDLLWEKVLNFPNYVIQIYPYKFHIDDYDNLYVLGRTANTLCLVKMNTEAEIVWIRQSQPFQVGQTTVYYQALTTDNDGNPVFLLTSQGAINSWLPSAGSRLIKYSSSGGLIRSSDIAGGSGVNPAGLSFDTNGNIYIMYCTTDYIDGANRIVIKVLKLNQNHSLLTTNLLMRSDLVSGEIVCFGSAIKLLSDNTMIVSGYSNMTYYYGGQYFPNGGWFTAKLNPDFTIQWVLRVGGQVVHTDDVGNIYLASARRTPHIAYDNINTYKISTSGVVMELKSVTRDHNSDEVGFCLGSQNDLVVSFPHESGLIYGDGMQIQADTGYCIANLGVPQGILEVTPTSLNLGLSSPGYPSATSQLVLKNVGNGDLALNSIMSANGINVWNFSLPGSQQLPYIITYRDSLVINLVFTPQYIGTYSDSLVINYTTDQTRSKYVRVFGQGVHPYPDQVHNVSISPDGHDMVLTWSPVVTSVYGNPLNIDYYFIYGSHYPSPTPDQQVFVGFSTSCCFRHQGVGLPGYNVQGPRNYFYTITAVVNVPRDVTQTVLSGLIGQKRDNLEVLIKGN